MVNFFFEIAHLITVCAYGILVPRISLRFVSDVIFVLQLCNRYMYLSFFTYQTIHSGQSFLNSSSSASSIHLFRKYSNIQFFTFTIFKIIYDDYIITIQRIQN